jgi:hypothetical protein
VSLSRRAADAPLMRRASQLLRRAAGALAPRAPPAASSLRSAGRLAAPCWRACRLLHASPHASVSPAAPVGADAAPGSEAAFHASADACLEALGAAIEVRCAAGAPRAARLLADAARDTWQEYVEARDLPGSDVNLAVRAQHARWAPSSTALAARRAALR